MTAPRRVVFSTFGSLGDLFPSLALAVEMKARGHRPLIASHESYRARVEAEGVEFQPVRPDSRDFGDEAALMAEVMDARRGPEVIIRRIFMPALRQSYEDLLAAVEGADLLVNHPITFAGPLVAEKRGLRWVSTALAPTTFFSNWDPPVLAPAPWLRHLRLFGPRVYAAVLDRLKNSMAGWTDAVRQLRAEIGLPPSRRDPLFAGQFSPTGTLGLYSPLLGAPQPDWPPNTQLTGFPFYDGPPGAAALDPGLEEFLAAGEPPIVFTLGSSAVMTARDFYAESSAAAARLGRRAVLLVGRDPRNQPAEPLPPEQRAVEYVSHAALFPRAAAIVHQAGIGTAAQALRSGRPALLVPYAFDQPDNAARIVRLGVARSLARGRYHADRVARELELLLGDPARLERAAEVGRQVRAEAGTKRAADLLEQLAG